MSLLEIAKVTIQGQLDEIASNIESDMKSEAKGRASSAIATEVTGEFTRFVGAHPNWGDTENDGGVHLYYSNYGNGGRNAIIKSTRETDRRGRKPGKLGRPPNGIPGYGYRTSVHGYDGEHFIEKIAEKYNAG